MSPQHYVCQKLHVLYDAARTTSDAIDFLNLTSGGANTFDPDPAEAAATGETGICVDFDSRLNQGCSDETLASVSDALSGCMDRSYTTFLCGLEVDIKHGDPTTASIQGNIFGKRKLIEATSWSPEMTCSDPVDCVNKCRYLSRNSFQGAGTPAACALCAPPDSNAQPARLGRPRWLRRQATSTAPTRSSLSLGASWTRCGAT